MFIGDHKFVCPMKHIEVKYNLQENFKPLNIINLNKLIIDKIEYLEDYKYTKSDKNTYTNTEMISLEKLKCTWSEVYSVKFDAVLDFVPGDSVGLLCPNNILLVNEILEYLNIPKESTFSIEQIGREGFKFEGQISHFFEYVFDSSSLPKKSWLIDVSKTSKKSRDLEYLCSREGSRDYLGMIKQWNNVLDILKTFECKPTLEDLLMNCQTIKPRFYSLTNKKGEEAEILVKIIQNGVRFGHVSDFLINSNLRKVKICHSHNKNFQILEESKILCICTGTGIAPFLSFVKNKSENQFIKIIYGLRNKEDDLSFNLQNDNIEIIKVYSSENQYVTDYLISNKEDINNFIANNCFVYLCGRPEMQKDVYEIFKEQFIDCLEKKRLIFDSWL